MFCKIGFRLILYWFNIFFVFWICSLFLRCIIIRVKCKVVRGIRVGVSFLLYVVMEFWIILIVECIWGLEIRMVKKKFGIIFLGFFLFFGNSLLFLLLFGMFVLSLLLDKVFSCSFRFFFLRFFCLVFFMFWFIYFVVLLWCRFLLKRVFNLKDLLL